tara:strand:- start:213 stop:569 length:357 start_codon:yes stop_codon:yes gene_type:complete
MQITINLNEDDVRVCKSIVAGQTHFVINSTCIEDAVISGILTQISKKNIAIAKAKRHFSKDEEKVVHFSKDEEKVVRWHREPNCNRKESELDIYEEGENIILYIQSGTLLCPDCIPEQ